MVDSKWTYEDLYKSIHILTSASSNPTTQSDLNPVIHQLLTTFPSSYISGVGGKSILIKISADIAAKVALQQASQYTSYEQSIFEMLQQTPCPNIVQTFFHCPDITFMQALYNGTLYDRMSLNQTCPILEWMQQLSDAAACLESYGYAHGDINPQNILLDDNGQLKLIDLDHCLKAGQDLNVGYEPYVRFTNTGTGGHYGQAGPITEQFALGSVFWFIYTGKELYEELEGAERVNNLIDRKFPCIDLQDQINRIIYDCWHGKFSTVADLSLQIRAIATANPSVGSRATSIPELVFQEKKSLCKQWYAQLEETGRRV